MRIFDYQTLWKLQFLHLLRHLLALQAQLLAVDEHDFPSDRYVVDGVAAATGRTVRHGFDRLDDVACREPMRRRVHIVESEIRRLERLLGRSNRQAGDLAGLLVVRLGQRGPCRAAGPPVSVGHQR